MSYFSILILAQCLCTPVFRGATCNQFSYVPCGDATCHGIQGVCIANRCVCKTGYAGPRCDSTDFCAAYPCLNGGTKDEKKGFYD